jgi:hypothetical protein
MPNDMKEALILEAQAAWREADEAHQRALSLALYKQSATKAALNGGVKATELAAALGVSRERCYKVGRGNRTAREVAAQ